MAALAKSVILIWELSVLAQSALFALLFWSRNFRKLPVLTAYVALNLCQAGYLLFLYSRVDFHSAALLAWFSEAATLLFQAFAAMEALRLVLAPYPGVWGLGWRSLALVSAIVLAYVAIHTAGNYRWALLEADRGYHLIFAAAVFSCFALIRYYSVKIPRAYKVLLAGFSFYSCVMILVNTVFQAILYRSFADYEQIWQFASILAFAIVQVMWAVALRSPLPAEDRPSASPSDAVYRRLSPQIDERLRLLDKKLARLWKWEAPSQ